MAHLVAKMKSFDFSDRMFKTPENVQKFTFAECREEAVNKIKKRERSDCFVNERLKVGMR